MKYVSNHLIVESKDEKIIIEKLTKDGNWVQYNDHHWRKTLCFLSIPFYFVVLRIWLWFALTFWIINLFLHQNVCNDFSRFKDDPQNHKLSFIKYKMIKYSIDYDSFLDFFFVASASETNNKLWLTELVANAYFLLQRMPYVNILLHCWQILQNKWTHKLHRLQ